MIEGTGTPKFMQSHESIRDPERSDDEYLRGEVAEDDGWRLHRAKPC